MYENLRYVISPINNESCGIAMNVHGVEYIVPLDPANTDYQNIMKLAEDGELTIADVEEVTTE